MVISHYLLLKNIRIRTYHNADLFNLSPSVSNWRSNISGISPSIEDRSFYIA